MVQFILSDLPRSSALCFLPLDYAENPVQCAQFLL